MVWGVRASKLCCATQPCISDTGSALSQAVFIVPLILLTTFTGATAEADLKTALEGLASIGAGKVTLAMQANMATASLVWAWPTISSM